MGDLVALYAGHQLPADCERAPAIADISLRCRSCGFEQWWLAPDGLCHCARCGAFSPVRRHFNVNDPVERTDGQDRQEARPQEPDPRQAG